MKHIRLKTGLQYGIIESLLNFLISIAILYAGLAAYNSGSNTIISLLITGLAIFLATEAFKKKSGGFMEASDVVVTSLWMGLSSGFLGGVLGALHFHFNPEIKDTIRNQMELQLENQGQSDEIIEKSIEMMEMFLQPGFLIAISIFSLLLMHLIVGGILSLFLKKERSIFED